MMYVYGKFARYLPPLFVFTAVLSGGRSAIAEVQTSISLTSQAFTPGVSSGFTASAATGPSAAISGTVRDTYSGVRKFTLGDDGTGRYQGYGGQARYGVLFGEFQIFRSFLTESFKTVVNSYSTCPTDGTEYNWLMVRFRSWNAYADSMDTSSTSLRVGGTVTYDSGAGADVTGSGHFSLQNNTTFTSASYNIDRFTAGCSSAQIVYASDGGKTWDAYGTAMFGSTHGVAIGLGANPTISILSPKPTSLVFTSIYDAAFTGDGKFSGLMTAFNSRSSQVRSTVRLDPNAGDHSFSIKVLSDPDDPLSTTDYGTLYCGSANSPAAGFCSGTLDIASVGYTPGKAVCMISTAGNDTLLACNAQIEGSTFAPVTILAIRHGKSVLAAIPAGIVTSPEINPPTPPEVTVTLTNLGTSPISSLSGQALSSPFAYAGSGSFPGGGTCSTTLNGFDSCTVIIQYNPSALGTTGITARFDYNNGVDAAQATANVVGVTGLSSIAITPGTFSNATGSTRGFTATATYSDSSTQNVSSYVTWVSSDPNIATISSTGTATFLRAGAVTFTASAQGISSPSVGTTVTVGFYSLDTSTSTTATASYPQRKLFYDSVNDRHWACYYNGSAIECSYSTDDGASWASGGNLLYSTTDFHVSFRAISGTGYLYVVVANGNDIVLRRGTLSTTGVTFDSAVTVFDGSSSTDAYSRATLSVDGSNYVWVTAVHTRPDFPTYEIRAVRSTNAADASLSSWQTSSRVGSRYDYADGPVLVPKTGSEMYLVFRAQKSLVSYLYNGSSWSVIGSPTEMAFFNLGGAGETTVHSLSMSPTGILYAGTSTGAYQYSSGVWDCVVKCGDFNGGTVYAVYANSQYLYVGGNFSSIGGNTQLQRLARWPYNSATWSPLGSGTFGASATVYAITGSGTNTYVGGDFQNAGGNANADRLALITNASSAISAVGNTSLSSGVRSLYHDGTNLYVGGGFADAGGNTNADRLVAYTGSSWLAVGNTAIGGNVQAILVDGTNIYIGGAFSDAGGNTLADRVAYYDGSQWRSMASGLIANVQSLAKTPDGIIAGGYFTNAGGNSLAKGLALWNGTAWTAVGAGMTSSTVDIKALVSSGNNLYIGGIFEDAGGNVYADNYALWDRSSFSSIAKGLTGAVQSIAVSGSNVYVGGTFTDAGGNANADYIAMWDGTSWKAMGLGFVSSVEAIHVSGTNVYAGGSFFEGAGGNASLSRIARWDGSAWQAMGSGVNGAVNAVFEFGGNIYIGGAFINAGGNANADYIARWSGAAWTALSGTAINNTVEALATDGSNLLVAGSFTNAGGNADADYLARFDGATWTAFNSMAPDSTVDTLTVSGSNVYIGGYFTSIGGNTTYSQSAWHNGTSWNDLGLNGVIAMEVMGGNLYATGTFTEAGGNTAVKFAGVFDGATWAPLTSQLNGNGYALTTSSDSVYIGGDFTMSPANRLGVYTPAVVQNFVPLASAASTAVTAYNAFGEYDTKLNVLVSSANSSVNSRLYIYDSGWTSTEFNAGGYSAMCGGIHLSDGKVYTFASTGVGPHYKNIYTPGVGWTGQTLMFTTNPALSVTCAETTGGGGLATAWMLNTTTPSTIRYTLFAP